MTIFLALLAIAVGLTASISFTHQANKETKYKRIYIAQDLAFLGGLCAVAGVLVLLYATGGR